MTRGKYSSAGYSLWPLTVWTSTRDKSNKSTATICPHRNQDKRGQTLQLTLYHLSPGLWCNFPRLTGARIDGQYSAKVNVLQLLKICGRESMWTDISNEGPGISWVIKTMTSGTAV